MAPTSAAWRSRPSCPQVTVWMAQQGWSADGTKLVFTCTCPQNTNSFGPHSGVYTANADGSDLTKLNDDGQYPDWSPDGTTIAFFSDRDGNEEVSTIRRDGTGLTRVTDTPAYEEFPIWTPDGRIAFSRGEPNDTETPPTWHLV